MELFEGVGITIGDHGSVSELIQFHRQGFFQGGGRGGGGGGGGGSQDLWGEIFPHNFLIIPT